MKRLAVILLAVLLLGGLEQANAQIVITPFGGDWTQSTDCFLDAEGKIVVGGYTMHYSGKYAHPGMFAVARYSADGVLDPTFGTGGIVTTQFKNVPAWAWAAAAYPGGRIVLGGYAEVNLKAKGGWQDDFALARYNSTGSLDTSFAAQKSNYPGTVTSDLGGQERSRSLGVQSDGKIVAIGHGATGPGQGAVVLARYLPTGKLDTTFGDQGVVWTPCLWGGYYRAAALSGDKIVVLGCTYGPPEENSDFVLVRYNSDGSLDQTFGQGTGRVVTDFTPNDRPEAVAVDAQGNIFAGGGVSMEDGYHACFGVAKYTAGGALDQDFGSGQLPGLAANEDLRTNFSGAGLAIQADGKIVAAGEAYYDDAGVWRDGAAVARFNADGTVDSTFGEDYDGDEIPDGYAVIPGLHPDDSSVVIQQDGKIVVSVMTGAGFCLIRYTSDGIPDETFGQ